MKKIRLLLLICTIILLTSCFGNEYNPVKNTFGFDAINSILVDNISGKADLTFENALISKIEYNAWLYQLDPNKENDGEYKYALAVEVSITPVDKLISSIFFNFKRVNDSIDIQYIDNYYIQNYEKGYYEFTVKENDSKVSGKVNIKKYSFKYSTYFNEDEFFLRYKYTQDILLTQYSQYESMQKGIVVLNSPNPLDSIKEIIDINIIFSFNNPTITFPIV